MNTLLHREGENDLDEISVTKDREINLGATMILGIFFALAVLCAVFFGFGYSMGRKSASLVIAPPPTPTGSKTSVMGLKPGAGSPLDSGQPASPAPNSDNSVSVPYSPAPAPRPAPTSETTPPESSTDEPVAPAVKSPVPTVTPGGSAIVQVAAVSHQEDADLLVTTLKRRGYSVAIRNEPQDKLLHVQVGPFASHKEADAMRLKLLADGFNAIVKDGK